jgi:hypothetical protein
MVVKVAWPERVLAGLTTLKVGMSDKDTRVDDIGTGAFSCTVVEDIHEVSRFPVRDATEAPSSRVLTYQVGCMYLHVWLDILDLL